MLNFPTYVELNQKYLNEEKDRKRKVFMYVQLIFVFKFIICLSDLLVLVNCDCNNNLVSFPYCKWNC